MNVPLLSTELVIDSFAGGGGASEGIRLALGRDPDIAVNHDGAALAMHRMNHPGTHHVCEDVVTVDSRALCRGRPIGLLWMSPDCFPAGTLVLTDRGYRAIETLAIGDRVLTHRGRWRPVTETSRAVRPLLSLRGHGHPDLRVSPEHPIYARRRDVRWDNEVRQDVPVYGDPEWMPASLLGPGSYRYRYDDGRRAVLAGGWYWASPRVFPAMDIPAIGGRSHPIDQNLMWLAGRYLGDGWTRLTDRRAELVITCGQHERDDLRPMLHLWQRTGARARGGELAWHERATDTAYQFTTDHRGLVEWLREQFGHRAEAKGLPAWSLGMREDLRAALLQGYLSADGYRRGNHVGCTTVSKSLAFGLKALAASLGHIPTVFTGRSSGVIAGRIVNARPIWTVRWREPLLRRQAFDDGLHQWSPIRERTEAAGEAEVFNIGVDEDESYVVEGIVVHNCKHHSKAKGGRPRDKNIRGLAWTVLGWTKRLSPWQRPRVVCLENVEEFADWGPLLDDGKPCPVHRGATFQAFVASWQALGYVVEWRELRACDFGVPTIRKRLYMVMRRDGLPIVWPEPTHGDPKSEAVRSGRLKPWTAAASIIDWSLPCPSIFETSAEIKARWGIRAIRPLVEATMARIAKGTKKYVIDAATPFVVPIAGTRGGTGDDCSVGKRGEWPPQAGASRSLEPTAALNVVTAGETATIPFVSHAQHGGRSRDATDPLHTLTASRKDQDAIVAPFVTKFNRGATGHPMDEPLHTITSHTSETHGGGAAPLGIVAPHLVHVDQTSGNPVRKGVHSAEEPVRTLATAGGLAVVTPFLAPRYQEKPGDAPRLRSVEEPAATIIGGDNVPGHLVAPYLVPRYGERPGQEPRTRSLEEPAPVVVPTGNEGSLAAVHLSRQFGASVGSAADEPVGTITAGGAGKAAVVAAFLAQHNEGPRPGAPGRPAYEPISTIRATGGQQGLVAAHLTHAYTSNTRGGEGDLAKPTKTVVAGGQHAALVSAFLAKYYGAGEPVQAADDPLHTVTANPRHGLVAVTIAGEPYVIVDIGMRMLTPRERFSAQGFRPDYEIETGLAADGSPVRFTLEQQGRFCGNSVCPEMARVLVAANYTPMTIGARPQASPPRFSHPWKLPNDRSA